MRHPIRRLLVLALAAAILPAAGRADNPKATPTAPGKSTKSDGVVKVTVQAEPAKPGADGKQVLTVSLAIDKGWHIYANPVGNDDLTGSQTVVKVAGKNPPVVSVAYPPGKEIKDALGNYKTYEDKVAIKASVRRTGGDTGPLEVSVTFQACDAKSCLLPATVKLIVP